jgi:HPt (histidine-containing phosphotransfer) domain-containing protein
MPAVNPMKASETCAVQSAAPVDLGHLRRYTMGDHALEVEILGLFSEQLPITIGALKNAPSAKEWGIAAHTLKGSARAVGAWSLATIAESAEKLQRLPDAGERGLVVRRLEEAAGEARAYIASLCHAA